MGLFSSLFVLTLLRDAVLLLAAGGVLVRWRLRPRGWCRPRPRRCRRWPALMTLLGLRQRAAHGGRGAGGRADRPACRPALHGFTIAQISDIHVGPTIKRGYLQAHRRRGQPRWAPTWWRSPATWSTARWRELARACGAAGRPALAPRHLLRHRQPRVLLGRPRLDRRAAPPRRARADERARGAAARATAAALVLAGVTDCSAHHFDEAHRSDPHAAIAGAPARRGGARCCWRTSRAAPRRRAQAGFDLQLSGHTHGGQFWPWNFFVRLQQPFTAGLHRLAGLVGLHQPRHRLLGTAQALRRAVGDHPPAAGGGLTHLCPTVDPLP